MKKNIYSLLFIALLLFSAQLLTAKINNIELGARYLKLGNTYRVSRNFDLSKKYLIKGKDLVEGKNKYWTAVAYEYLGYYYYDTVEDKTKAIENLNKAQLIYKEIIKQKEGSQNALASLLDIIQFYSNKKIPIDQNIKQVKKTIIKKNKKFSKNDNSAFVINLDNQRLKELPNTLPKHLTNLSIADNKFRNFPTSVFQYKDLEYLNLANNKIRKLPDNIDKLKNLQFLDLSYNKLKKLPIALSRMMNLKFLNLKHNKISFNDISNLIRALPNTNILFDEFVRKPEAETGEEESPME